MGTLRFFEEVVSFKIRRTFGFADYSRTRQSRSAGAGKFRTSAPSATQLPCNMPCGVPLRSATKTEAGLFPQEKDPAPT